VPCAPGGFSLFRRPNDRSTPASRWAGPIPRSTRSRHAVYHADLSEDRRSAPMNCVYFACLDHHEYIDAGYRWAYWTLEEAGVVRKDHIVDIERVFAANEYWKPPVEEQSAWLCASILPAV